ncbi:hypothetical protein CWI39_1297p0010 [Hamiltosporidium magnivora]|uniref:Uncharacterized protein n=1 Tax=Hamiltosporidium magnivora TaxID=148818 RepID=A0A4Q9L411_9MICR|nr:hypothetical protein CWI39_1297p0010 [Hamiltosporidium magnivora]
MNIGNYNRRLLYVITIIGTFDYVFGASNSQCCAKKKYYGRKSSSSSSDDSKCCKSRSCSGHKIQEKRIPCHSRHLSFDEACRNHLKKSFLLDEREHVHSEFSCGFKEPGVSVCRSKGDTGKRLKNLNERVKLENIRLDNCKDRITNIRNIKIKSKCVKNIQKIGNSIRALSHSIRADGLNSSDIFDLELEADSIESSILGLENYLTIHDV